MKPIKTGPDSWTLGVYTIERRRYLIPRGTAYNVCKGGKRVAQFDRLRDAVDDINETLNENATTESN